MTLKLLRDPNRAGIESFDVKKMLDFGASASEKLSW